MKTTVKKQKKVYIIHLHSKRISSKNAKKLKEKLFDIIEKEFTKVLIINFQEVEFIDSTGVGVLVDAFQRMSKKDRSIKITKLQAPVHSLFEITRLNSLFDIFEDEKSAIKSLETTD